MRVRRQYGKLALVALLALGVSELQAQEDQPRELVRNTFSWSQVINAQSVEVVPRMRSPSR